MMMGGEEESGADVAFLNNAVLQSSSWERRSARASPRREVPYAAAGEGFEKVLTIGVRAVKLPA